VVWFTDPLIHSPEKEEEICSRFERNELLQWTISCKILEHLDDIIHAQSEESDHRDISMVSPLTLEGVVDELLKGAEQYRDQNPEQYSFRDF